MSIRRINPGPRMSQAVVHSGLVFLAGQVADDTSADVAGQTRQVLAKIDALLKEAGSDKSKILSTNIWLADINTFSAMSSVWDDWVDMANPPARATVEAHLAAPAYKVEIAAVAAVGQD
jgi:enamine deaminase RidA (YjgF/YER057c/UK114 family)